MRDKYSSPFPCSEANMQHSATQGFQVVSHHRMLSRQLKLSLVGDPAWEQAVAPVIPWVNAEWVSTTGPQLARIGIGEFRLT